MGARAERELEKMRRDPNTGLSVVQTHQEKELSAVGRAGPRAASVALAAISVIACADGETGPRVRQPTSIPESVSVSAAQVEVGTAIGTIRKHVQIPSFRMSRYPTTVAQYRECVEARACTPPARTTGACAASDQGPAGQTYSEAGAFDDAPVTCTALGQAAKYCEWVGGRLPRVEEWLGAARGPNVRRYAWADQRLACDKHPAAIAALGTKACCPADGCSAEQVALVGKHPAGGSPAGVEDVLLTPAELLSADPSSPWPACRDARAGCFVSTLSGGSIDAIASGPQAGDSSSSVPTWGFRCVWEE